MTLYARILLLRAEIDFEEWKIRQQPHGDSSTEKLRHIRTLLHEVENLLK